jgi:hypothetical protein
VSRLLADENIPQPAIKALRTAGSILAMPSLS